MKKTLLAAALLAGFATAGVAQAETSVTLYGILDTGYGYQNYKYNRDGIKVTAKSSGLRSGTVFGNRWGLRGSEDLGDGLRAIFTLENGFNIGTGSLDGGNMFNRQAFVGLSSDNWGTLTFGRQYGAGFDTNLAANGVNLGDMDKVFGSTGAGNRVDNSFKYTSPNFSGFTFIALYGTGPTGTGTWVARDNDGSLTERDNRLSIGGKYVNGPIAIGASYDRQSRTSVSDGDAMTNWQINGSYDFEVLKLSLAYGQDRHGKIGWAGSASSLTGVGSGDFTIPLFTGYMSGSGYNFKSNNYHVGLSAPVGGGTLYAGWNYSTSNLDSSNALDDRAGNISTYQINYQYPLSKRTSVYAYGSYGKNLGYLRDLKGTELGLGMNHKF